MDTNVKLTITNAKYKVKYLPDTTTEIDRNIVALVDGVYTTIPISEDNTKYKEIMRQVAAGELTIADAE